MSKIRITIDISSDTEDYDDTIREAMKGILDGNKTGRGENDAESYEFSVRNVYEGDPKFSF